MSIQPEPAVFGKVYPQAGPCGLGNRHSENQSSKNSPCLPTNYEGNDMDRSLGSTHVFNRGEHSANKHLHTDTGECGDWLAERLRDQSAKAIARKTGQGQRAAEAVKMGRNGLTMAHLVNICRTDPEFRAQFFQFCGGTLEGDPAMVAALSKAINAIVRRDA